MWFIFAIFISVLRTSSCQCRHGWVRHGNSCYLFGKDESLTWPEAAGLCAALQGHLVEIQNADEDHFILETLRHRIHNGHSYWIGGNDIASEKYWVWAKSGQKITYFNWSPGQPAAGRDSNCISLWSDNNYLWDDIGCTERHYSFICETELEPDVVG